MKKVFSVAICAAVIGWFGSAHALLLNPFNPAIDGQQSWALADGGTMSAWWGDTYAPDYQAKFDIKQDGGYNGIWVDYGSTDAVGGEIDSKEYIFFDLKTPSVIADITVLYLFKDGSYGDVGNEVAKFLADRFWVGYLDANGSYSGTNAATSSVSVLSAPVEGSGWGVFTVTNPFGDKVVDKMWFSSGNPDLSSPYDSKYGDFALGAVNTVPEPTTMLLFGAGLAGLAAVGRRRKN